jgi:GNAT superfamily N-acetyltransferase
MAQAYPLVDVSLVRRIEAATAADVLAWAECESARAVYSEAATLRVAGGIAAWFCSGNPVNGAFGIGMTGPVTADDVEAVVDFYRARRAPARIDVSPHADSSLIPLLAAAGFRVIGFEDVLYQPLPALPAPAPAPGVEVRVAWDEWDRALWAEIEARGFKDEDVSAADRALAGSISVRRDGMHFLGTLDGEAAGTGMLVMKDGVALFNGDATLPAKRGRGVQSAILAERLKAASEAGCDLAVIEAAPGGISHRNQQRAGFRMAYTRVSLERPRG